MAASLPSLADAVVAAMNAAGGWVTPFTAVRYWQPIFELQDLAELKVSVVGAKIESARNARRQWEQLYTVEIGLQNRPDGFTNLELDTLAQLAEEIAVYWETNTELTAGGRRYVCVAVQNEFVNFEDLDERRLFTSVVVLSFKAWR